VVLSKTSVTASGYEDWLSHLPIPHMAEKLPRRKAWVKAAPYAPRSGLRALTRAASRPCSSMWGLARAVSFEIFSIAFSSQRFLY
jgi:hypothetical protein